MPIRIQLPVTEDRVRALRVGDEVLVSGRMVTAREAAHRRLASRFEPALRAILEGRFVYHCGPVVAADPATGGWRFVAAGPSSSSRLETWEPEFVARYGIRGILGKGGMGPATLAALQEHGAVYLHPVGGLAVTLARRVIRVHGVHLLGELGVTDALWDVEVADFPAIVTMDAHGDTLHGRGEDAGAPSGAGA